MLTTGTKLLVGATVAAFVAAIVYGLAKNGTLGVVGLLSAATALGLLAGINLVARDSNVSAMDAEAVVEAPASRSAPSPSLWPLVVAGGAGLIVFGLVTEQAFFLLGVILVGLGMFEWMLEAWSERASADVAFNREARGRLSGPLEFPVLAAVAAVVVIFSFSRIMLFLSKTAGPVAFVIVALLILGGGFGFAYQKSVRSSAIAAITAIGALGLVAGGVAAGLEGERELQPHESTADLGDEAACDTSDETEADENATQTVGNKANVSAVITLGDGDELTASLSGGRETTRMAIGRSNAANVIFRNESNEPRRLVLSTGTKAAVDENGEEIEGERILDQRCTALAEEGGSQLLTFKIDKSSRNADEPFQFTVPGVDAAPIEVVVP